MQASPQSLPRFFAVAGQLALVLVALRLFGIEVSFGLDALLPVIFAGFAVNAWLPLRLRLPFFVLLSIAGFAVVIGTVSTAIVVAIGLALIGICHLPLAFGWRVVLLVLAGSGLAAMRIAWAGPPPPRDVEPMRFLSWRVSEVLPVVAAIFMFRLAVLSVRRAPRARALHGLGAPVLLLPAAQRLLPAVPRHRLRRLPAELLRRGAVPHLPEGGAVDGARAHSPAAVPRRLPLPDAGAGGGGEPGRRRAVHGVGVSAVPAHLGALPSGVELEDTLQHVVEQRLNAERPSHLYERYEILTFAVAGYSVAISAWQVEHEVLEFEPDVVLQMGTSNAAGFCKWRFKEAVDAGIELPYPELQAIQRESGIHPGMSTHEAMRRLNPYADRMVTWSFEKIVQLCRAADVVPAFVFLPRALPRDPTGDQIPVVLRGAEQAGFVMLSLEGAFGDVPIKKLQVAPWDAHPNALGHRLLAERLFREIRSKAEKLRLGPARRN